MLRKGIKIYGFKGVVTFFFQSGREQKEWILKLEPYCIHLDFERRFKIFMLLGEGSSSEVNFSF